MSRRAKPLTMVGEPRDGFPHSARHYPRYDSTDMPDAGSNSDSRAPLAIVTGASSGIGREIALRLARRGYRTAIIARRVQRIEELARELSAYAPSEPLPLDLSQPEGIEPAIAGLLARLGPAEVLVNNAGAGQYARFLDTSPQTERALMQVHYFSAAAMIRAVLPGMLRRRHGHVINIASISSKMGPWGHSTYASAKAAIVSLTQTLAAEHAADGVHFSYVNPGIVATEFFNDPHLASVAERNASRHLAPAAVAEAVVRLLDRPRLELCIPRHYRLLDWINALSPTLAHWLVARESRPVMTKQASPIDADAQPAPHEPG